MKNRYMILRKLKPACVMTGLLAASLCSSPVLAENWADRINVTGFMSAKYQKIDKDLFFNGDDGTHDDGERGGTTTTAIGKDGSWTGTMLGLNLNTAIDDRITLAAQLLATLEDGDYAVHLDWGIVSYALTDEFRIRAGKIKFPTGIVNEYVSVGNAYPWITPPMLFYTEESDGPNITREAYTGASALWEYSSGDMNMNADVFGGEIKLEGMFLRNVTGAKFHIDWNEEINFQASYYRGIMRGPEMRAMEGLAHTNVALGMRIDWNNIVGYAEWADTDMETRMMNGSAWYTTWGYQMGNWLPHLSYQYLEKPEGTAAQLQEQTMSTAGLRYDLSDSADIKFEYSVIKTEKGRGLFTETPTDKSINMFGVAIDVVF